MATHAVQFRYEDFSCKLEQMPVDSKQQDHLAILSEWAEWGKAWLCRPDWSVVEAFINVAEPQLLQDARRLLSLLERSAEQLKFEDPLLFDLGVHRWLEKETSYSDWLAWTLERLGSASTVLDVLGVQNPEFVARCMGDYFVQREVQVKKGLAGSRGQIDILIRFGEPPRALLGIEVKTEDQQYMKQQGYKESLYELCRHVECVLVAKYRPAPSDLHGFMPRQWRDIGIMLRKRIGDTARQHEICAGMILGFAAAIEQNLLRFGTAAPRRAWRHKSALVSPDLFQYLGMAIGVTR